MWCYFDVEHEGQVYPCEALRFLNPSMFGINNGRVSKLWIYDAETKKSLWMYERGWYIDENDEYIKPPDALLAKILEAAGN
jgi:hypothetical protein